MSLFRVSQFFIFISALLLSVQLSLPADPIKKELTSVTEYLDLDLQSMEGCNDLTLKIYSKIKEKKALCADYVPLQTGIQYNINRQKLLDYNHKQIVVLQKQQRISLYIKPLLRLFIFNYFFHSDFRHALILA